MGERAPIYTAGVASAMKTVEERLTVVEHKVEENARRTDALHEAIVEIGNRMDRRFEALEQRMDRRFEAMDRRFEALEQRFDAIDRRFDAIDRRFEVLEQRFAAVDRRFEIMDQRYSRQFFWIVGIQMTTLLAVAGAIVTLASALGR